MSRVFVTRRIPEAGLIHLREGGAEVRVGQRDEEGFVDRDVLLEGTRWADVLLSLLTEAVDRAVLEANPRLRGVANYAVGFNNVDVVSATMLGLPVTNTPGVLTETTADLTWALLLAVARRIPEAHAYMAGGRYRTWGPNLLLGDDVSSGGSGRRKVLGIVGFGRIGQAVARRATGFGMDVLAHDPRNRDRVEAFGPPVRWAELDQLLAESDFVTLHPRLTPETHHLVDARALDLMKSTAYLVNVARGEMVDERALVHALRKGGIAGAALDVFEEEPHMAPGLAELPNVVLAPHIGSASRDTRDRMAVMAADNALHHLRGERAPHVVNPDVYGSEAWRRRTTGEG
ncbi:MAG: D-glycerate dehydrogenase [Gemmatimonadetes bacterium]|nr:D-glycerate dehydrogenase [Gemmatimonadota bacterium]